MGPNRSEGQPDACRSPEVWHDHRSRTRVPPRGRVGTPVRAVVRTPVGNVLGPFWQGTAAEGRRLTTR